MNPQLVDSAEAVQCDACGDHSTDLWRWTNGQVLHYECWLDLADKGEEVPLPSPPPSRSSSPPLIPVARPIGLFRGRAFDGTPVYEHAQDMLLRERARCTAWMRWARDTLLLGGVFETAIDGINSDRWPEGHEDALPDATHQDNT